MIRLTCTQCKTVLMIDDGFAGGVCRCQHCGTIQTVPGKSQRAPKPGAAPSTKAAPRKSPKALYRTRAAREANTSTQSGTGLDELAGLVTSSGLRSGRLSTTTPQVKRQIFHIYIVGGIVALLIIVLGVWIFFRTTPHTSDTASLPTTPGEAPARTQAPAVPAGPSFCGVPLAGPSVIYIVDRGSATGAALSYVKEACFRSIESLGSDRKFQILFWTQANGSDAAYPVGTMTYATKENIDAAKRTLADVIAFGQTNVDAPITRAISQAPSAIMLVTGKGWNLDDQFVKTVLNAWNNSDAKIHTFAVNETGTSEPLRQIAQKTGGTYHNLSEADLRAFSQ